MKTFAAILLAGAFSIAVAQPNDFGAAERFHMKYGQGAPVAEARHSAAPRAASAVAPRNDFGAAERFRMKFGRATPAEEAQLQVAAINSATWASWEEPGVAVRAARAAHTDFGAAERFRMKFGHTVPAGGR